MRSAGGIDVIHKAITDGLSKYHDRHIMLYDPTLVSPPHVCMCVIECRVSWGGGVRAGRALVPLRFTWKLAAPLESSHKP